MKSHPILTTTIASLLLTLRAFAVNDTWDGNQPGGGVGDSNITNGLNWADDSAPVSDLINTDLIFGGTTKLAPNFNTVFSTDSIAFINTAGAFVLGGSTITIGTSGIANSDTQTQTINNNVTLGTPSSSFQAINGSLLFNGTLALGTNSLSVSGAQATNLAGAITGTGTINKSGTGTLTLSNTTIAADVNISGGAVNVASAGTTTFNSNSTININAGTFDAAGNVTLDNAQLIRDTLATLSIAATKTLTLQNGADATITGIFANSTASTITVTGSGSTFTTTSNLTLNGGSTTNILAGGSMSAGSSVIDIATNGTGGTVTIDGASSALTLTGAGTAAIGAAAGSAALLNVQNGGVFNSGTGTTTVNATGDLAITGGTFNSNGNLTLNGGGLTRDASGAFNLAAGRTFTVQNGGDVSITGDHLFANALTLNVTGAGSTFVTVGGVSDLRFDGGLTGNVTAGGSVSVGGALTISSSNPGTLTVDGSGSMLTVGGILFLGVGSGENGALNVLSGADATTGNINLATSGSATGNILVSGAGSTLTQNGTSLMIIGNPNAVQARLRVEAGGVFSSGTGFTTMNGPGVIEIAGGTYNANGDLTMGTNSQLTKDSAGSFNLAAGRTLTIQSGADAIFTGPFGPVGANVTLNGAGSTLQVTDSDISIHSTFSVLNGATLSAAARVSVGTASAGTLFVSGAGSSVSAGDALSSHSFWGSGANANVTFSNDATGSYIGLEVARVGTTTTVAQILSGADVTNSDILTLGDFANVATNGTITVNGLGSTWTQTGASTVIIGAPASSTAILNLQSGGTFTSGTGTFTINPTGVVNLDGGTLTLNGPITNNGTLNFNAGALNLSENITIGIGGLFGTSLTLDSTRHLSTTAATEIDFFRVLTLNGGTLTTSELLNNGTLAFNSGTLAITGAGGFEIGSDALGANVTLGTGANLEVTNAASIASGATLTMNGGTFVAGALNNTGTLRANLGVVNVGALTNNNGGRIFVGDTLNASGPWTNVAGSQLTMENSGLVNGAGSITNSGLVTGDGTIAKSFTNASGGEVRGEFGKTLYFTGATGANAGRLNLLGGTLQFTQQFTNSATGQINGQGALYFPTTPVPSNGSPTAGLMNAGNINLTGGDSQVYGTVQMQAGSRLIVSGGATASFFDVFRHSGTEVRASAGSNIVFFGEVRGAGSFTGTGTTYFEGGYSPGNSPALITHGGNVVFGTFNTLTMEIGGTTRGTQYDALDVAGKLTFDGTMDVVLINAFQPQLGNSFNLFDWGTTAGAFTTVNVPALNTGLAWNQSNLYIDGTLSVGLDTVLVSRTWDGGGANNDWGTDFNWDLNVEPLNNGTAQLIFAGNVRLTPSVDATWNVASITFNNTAGAFTITGPQDITVGAGGITNNDADLQTITAQVTLFASESFTAALGDLAFTNVNIGPNTLTIAGANDVELDDVSGTGTIIKSDAGTLDIIGALGTGGITLNANEGTTNIGADQTLAALNIGASATVVLGAIAPADSLYAIPEPGVAILIASGLLGVFGRRRCDLHMDSTAERGTGSASAPIFTLPGIADPR